MAEIIEPDERFFSDLDIHESKEESEKRRLIEMFKEMENKPLSYRKSLLSIWKNDGFDYQGVFGLKKKFDTGIVYAPYIPNIPDITLERTISIQMPVPLNKIEFNFSVTKLNSLKDCFKNDSNKKV